MGDMTSLEATRWYSHSAARDWRTQAPGSAVQFHRTLDGYAPTPLTELPSLAAELSVGRVFVKDESNRLGLPAFKILGASWATCRALSDWLGMDPVTMTVPRLSARLREVVTNPKDLTLVTATDGNHGRAVSRMAALLGVSARVYIPAGLSRAAVDAIGGEGAQVIAFDGSYDEVVAAANASTADRPLDFLIQDTSWDGYVDVPRWIVEGYITLFAEIDESLRTEGLEPNLVACPVGVGSLAHAMVDHYRSGGARPSLLSVEPITAACVAESLGAGTPTSVDTSTPTIMAGLNCGTPSAIGWPSLQQGLDAAISISDDESRTAVADLTDLGQDVGPCGAASLAGVRAALSDADRRRALGLGSESVVVLISTEGLAANPLDGR